MAIVLLIGGIIGAVVGLLMFLDYAKKEHWSLQAIITGVGLGLVGVIIFFVLTNWNDFKADSLISALFSLMLVFLLALGLVGLVGGGSAYLYEQGRKLLTKK